MKDPLADLTPYVVVKLARSANRSEIIHWVCDQRGCMWREGEQLVNTIEDAHREEIRKRRSPVLFIISALAVVAGLVWALVGFGGIVLPIWILYRESGGWIDAAAWLLNFWIYLPHLLAGCGLAIGGFFGIAAVLKKRDQVDWAELAEKEE